MPLRWFENRRVSCAVGFRLQFQNNYNISFARNICDCSLVDCQVSNVELVMNEFKLAVASCGL